jgi:hypothetical protein
MTSDALRSIGKKKGRRVHESQCQQPGCARTLRNKKRLHWL